MSGKVCFRVPTRRAFPRPQPRLVVADCDDDDGVVVCDPQWSPRRATRLPARGASKQALAPLEWLQRSARLHLRCQIRCRHYYYHYYCFPRHCCHCHYYSHHYCSRSSLRFVRDCIRCCCFSWEVPWEGVGDDCVLFEVEKTTRSLGGIVSTNRNNIIFHSLPFDLPPWRVLEQSIATNSFTPHRTYQPTNRQFPS